MARRDADTAESKTLCMCRNSKRENREIPSVSVRPRGRQSRLTDRPENATDGKAGMNVDGKSDGSIVPAKSANKGATEPPAEPVEERDPAKRNVEQTTSPRTPSRKNGESRGLDGVREAARKDGKLKFTALLHHVDEEALRQPSSS